VKNPLGVHARPATLIAKLLQGSKSSVTFTYKKETINARSIMSILMMAISRNAVVTVTAEGEDAHSVMKKIVAAFESGFGEDESG
jgi:phosphocarrier protein